MKLLKLYHPCRLRHTPRTGDFVPYHLLILGQHQVISAQCDAENNGCDSFETVDPLLPLRALASHIEHSAEGMKQKEIQHIVCECVCVCALVGVRRSQ